MSKLELFIGFLILVSFILLVIPICIHILDINSNNTQYECISIDNIQYKWIKFNKDGIKYVMIQRNSNFCVIYDIQQAENPNP